MKKTLILLAVILAFGAVYGQTLVYYWNFNANTPAVDQTWAQPIASTIGSGQLSYTFTEAFSFAGTTMNGTDGEVNGGSFAPRGGVDMVNNGAYFTLTASTVGYDNIVLSYPTRKTSTGFNTQEFKYTINGTDWLTKETVDISGYENNWVAGQAVSVDFTGVAGVANNPNFAIRVVLTGCTSAVGNNRIDNIRITAASQGAVATPTFNPPEGVFTQPVNVAINTTTPGATIYYTTNGTTPSQSSTPYNSNNPIPVNVSTTIKAIAYASGLDASNVATASYMFPVVVQNMTQLRNQTAGTGTVYMVSGEVILTFKQGFRGQKYVQDANAGVLIDDLDGVITTSYNLMDGITGLTGTIAVYNNMLQLIPMADPGPAHSTNNYIAPPTITVAQLNANVGTYQARLVRIANAHFVETGSFAVGANYTLQDATGTVAFRTTFYDVDYIGTAIPTGNFNIWVLVNQFNQTPQVTARALSDWSGVANDDEVAVTTQLIGNYPNPFNPSTTISYYTQKAEPVQIIVYNQKGQTVKTWAPENKAAGNHSVEWDGRDDNGIPVSSGIYFYRMHSGKYSSTRKMVLMK